MEANPKSRDAGLSETAEFRLSAEEKEAFKLAASIAGVPLSSWIRERLRKAAARELEEQGQQVPFYRSLTR